MEHTVDRLREFETHIRAVMEQFREAFGQSNPVPLRMSGKLPRTGFIPPNGAEYSIHGLGCTVERAGRLVSFDFDAEGGYCYSAFKFGLFLDADDVSDASIASEFRRLIENGTLLSIPGQGVRLADSPHAH